VLFFAVLAGLEIAHGVTRLGSIRRERSRELVDTAARALADLAAELRARGAQGRRHAAYVARMPAVAAAVRGGGAESRPELSGQLLAQLSSFPEIDRVRVLSDDGRELFRCERMGGGVATIPPALLAREPDAAARELAATVEPGGVAVSDLFVDRDRVEVTEGERKVLHHVARPPAGLFPGFVVVTLYASPLLDRVRTFEPVEGARSMLVSRADGDYVATPDRSRERGSPTASKLAADHAGTEPLLAGAERVEVAGSFFLAASAGDLPWLVVVEVPESALAAATRKVARESAFVIAGMVATLLLILAAAVVFHRLTLRAFRLREAEASLRQLEEKREMERRLTTAERLGSLGLLTAGVAHEINNPLEGIGNYLALLEREDVPPDKRQRYITSVRHGFERIREVVRKLLGFARPVRGAGSADLRRVVAHAHELARFSKDCREVTFELPAEDGPIMVNGDEGALEQVLLNLFLNAGRAMGGRGRIAIGLRRDADEAEVVVDDEGPGIPPAQLGRIFDPFFTTGEGSGLGLSVSYGIAQAHGGTLAAVNLPGRGARFTLRLPASRPAPAPAPSRSTT
jgi:signal transduction histidine kinase